MVVLLLPGVVLFFFLCTAVLIAILERRHSIDRIVVGQIAAVTSQSLPLAGGLMLAGQSEPGKAGVVLRRIARLLAAGLPLGEALRYGYPSCPGMVASVVQAGELAGRLPAVLRMLESDLVERARQRHRAAPFGVPYAIFLLFFLIVIETGVMVLIVPKFEEIFRDFRTNLPGLTRAFIDAARFCANTGIGALLILAFVLGALSALYWVFRPRRFDDPHRASQVADYIRWCTPGLRRLERANGLAVIASLLKLFVGAGMGLDRAARLAAEADVNAVLRDRMRDFVQLLESGTPPPDAAERAGLGPVMTTALRAGRHGDRLDASLQFVADYYRAVVSRLWIVIRSVAWPVMTLCMASLIGSFIVALFLPLISLINSVMERM